MNLLKTLCALLFMMSVVFCSQAFAQTQNEEEQTEVNSEESTDDYGDYDDYGEYEEVDGSQETVTLEGEEDTGSSYDEESTSIESKPATKIHIYSGKHDGDNVINRDPRR